MFFYSAIAGSSLIVIASLRQRNRYLDTYIAAGILLTILLLQPFSLLEGFIAPVTMDLTLRSIDLELGLDGFALAMFCSRHYYVWWLGVVTIYYALPFFIGLAWVMTKSIKMIKHLLVATLLALPCYVLFPAVGPSRAFTHWPIDSLLINPISSAWPRNCMPSMHFSSALIIALHSKGKFRPIAWLYVILMVLSTVGSGEHYCIDILAAIPFTFAVYCLDWPKKWPAFGCRMA